MNTDLQPKKSLSRKRQSTKREELISRITKNDWNPFERATPSVLEILHIENTKKQINNYGEALL